MEWYALREPNFIITVPDTIKKLKVKCTNGCVLKGPVKVDNKKVVFLLAVAACPVNPHHEKSLRYILSFPNPYAKKTGVPSQSHYWGKSITRTGGYENQVSYFPEGTSDELPRWSMEFPLNGQWVQLDVGAIKGGIAWDAFKPIAVQIIDSFNVVSAG